MTEEELKQIGRREVAEKIAELFGICITYKEADRFLNSLDKAVEELEVKNK